MSLQVFIVTVITKSDSPFNVLPNSPIEIREREPSGNSGSLSLIFSDQAGLNPITQPGLTTNSLGQAQFYAAAADYNAVYDNNGTPVTIAVDVGVTGGILNERFNRLNPATLAEAIDNEDIEENDILNVFEYFSGTGGGGTWKAVLASSVITNPTHIRQSTGVPTLAIVLQIDEAFDIKQFGALDNSDNTIIIAAAIDALPATGGTIDARSLIGTQTISSDIFASRTKPFTLLLGRATYEIDMSSYTLSLNSHQHIIMDDTICQADVDDPNGFFGSAAFWTTETTLTTGTIAASSDQLTLADTSRVEIGTLLAIQGARGPTTNLQLPLDAEIDATTTTVPFADASDIPASYTMIVGTEIISGTEKSGNDLINVTRGALGTTAAIHLISAEVSLMTHMRAFVKSISGSAVTLSESATTSVTSAEVEVGAVDVVIDGNGTIDGRQDRSQPQPSGNLFGINFRLARNCRVGDDLTIKNWDHGGVYLESAFNNYVGGTYSGIGRPVDGSGATIWIFRNSNENVVNIKGMDDGFLGIFTDDRTSNANRMDGPNIKNTIYLPVCTNHDQAVSISGSKDNTVYAGNVETSDTTFAIATNAGQGTTDRPVSGNTIIAGSVESPIASAVVRGDDNYIQIASTNASADPGTSNSKIFVMSGDAIGLYTGAGSDGLFKLIRGSVQEFFTDETGTTEIGPGLNNAFSLVGVKAKIQNLLVHGIGSGIVESVWFRDDLTTSINDILVNHSFGSADSGEYLSASMRVIAAASWSASSKSTKWEWRVTPVGTIAQIVGMTLSDTGDLAVTGAISKGSGTFKIDHPLESMKDTHHLVHSFIEGPLADLIYRGTVTLLDGKADINIDDAAFMTEGTFTELCGNVQCFTSNESGFDRVRGYIEGNILHIECETSTCSDSISWMVIGERIDQHMIDVGWTDDNGRVITEPLKIDPAEEEAQEEEI